MCLRKILRFYWLYIISNAELWEKTKQEPFESIQKRKYNWNTSTIEIEHGHGNHGTY